MRKGKEEEDVLAAGREEQEVGVEEEVVEKEVVGNSSPLGCGKGQFWRR